MRVAVANPDSFVVLETAPACPALRWLDATGACHREFARHASNLRETVGSRLPSPRDGGFTRILDLPRLFPCPV